MEYECEEKTHPRWENCKEEVKPSLPKKGLRLRLLGLLGVNSGFDEPLSIRGESVHVGVPVGNHFNYRKEIETALLEAERKKARARAAFWNVK